MKSRNSDEVAADRKQRGSRARGGFAFQDKCAALGILRALNTGNLSEVAVEFATDLVVYAVDGSREFISIKGRELDQRSGANGWTWGAMKGSRVLLDLYLHWDRGGRRGSSTVWTNVGLQGKAVDLSDYPNVSEATQADVLKRVAESILGTTEDARSFLSCFYWPQRKMPHHHDIGAVLETEARLFLESRKLELDRAGVVVEALLDVLAVRSTKDERTVPHVTVEQQHRAAVDDLSRLRHISSEELRLLITAAAEPVRESPLHQIVHLSPDEIIGRDDALAELHDWWLSSECRVAIISGPVGVGKTSLALSFASACEAKRVFVGVASTSAMAEGVIQALRSNEALLTGNDLVIIDGVIDDKALQGFLAQSVECRMIITSTRTMRSDHKVHVLEIDELTRFEALALVDFQLKNKEGGAELVKLLGGNPLALTQATAVCFLEKLSPAEYVATFSSQIREALNVGGSSDPLHGLGIAPDPRRRLTSAFDIHISHLQQREPEDLEVLRVVACCGPGAFLRARLTSETVGLLNGKDVLVAADFTDEEQKILIPYTQKTLIEPLHRLREQSLIKLYGNEVQMHDALRRLVIAGIESPRAYMEYLVGSFMVNDGPGLLTFPMSLRIAREASSVIATAQDLKLLGPSLYTLASRSANFLQAQGRIDDATRLGDLAHHWVERLDGEIDPVLWASEAAVICEWQLHSGREAEAVPWLLRLASQSALPDVYARAAERIAALATSGAFDSLLDIAEQAIPPMESDLQYLPAVAVAYLQLGRARLLWHSGDGHSALGLLDVANEQLRLNAPEARAVKMDIDTLWASLSNELPGSDRIPRLGELLTEIEHSHEDARMSHLYIHSTITLADAHLDYEQIEPAAKLLNQATESLELHHPQDDQAKAFLYSVQGRLYGLSFDPDTLQMAKSKLLKAVELSQLLPRGHSPFLPAAWFNLAQCLARLGDPDAIEAAVEAARLDSGRLGPNHPEVRKDLELVEWLTHSKTLWSKS